MRMPAYWPAIVACLVIFQPSPALAQVDQQRAQEFFKEATAVCERDGGRLWGVSICAPMAIGDARTKTFATSQPPADAPRPNLIGIANGPVLWGDTMWATITWDTISTWPASSRGEAFAHEAFHIIQRRVSVALSANPKIDSNEHLDSVEGRYWLRLEWRALARALRESGDARTLALRDVLAFRQARHLRFPDYVDAERAYDILEGFASYTQTVLAASSGTAAITRALEVLKDGESGESFVRTFAYVSDPAYGLLLDAASPGWPRRVRIGDDPPTLLMRALAIQPAPDVAAAAQRYAGAEIRAAEEKRDQQRQDRIAELRRKFIDGPVLVTPGTGRGMTDSRGAVAIQDVGTIYFGTFSKSGPWGTLEAEKGVLVATDGRTQRVPAPGKIDGATISGDGWTFKAGAGWIIREGPRPGDYQVVQQQ